MIRYLKQWLAYRKLNKLVTRSRARSEQYAKRRAAALKFTRRQV